MEFLFVVQERFGISGRGMAIVGPPGSGKRLSLLTRGQTIELRRPDGSVVRANAFVEHVNPSPLGEVALHLPALSQRDVPPGTEVWA